jgi:pyrimidine deaminase RibD-like protein
MTEEDERRFMHLALLEGRKALPGCIPNPPVGCVLVRDGQVIATGYTNPPGKPHAEAMALSQLSGSLPDVTAFVTLEPCSFRGRTPSCALELVGRGVRRVFVAIIDPDPRNNGAGIRLLEQSGVHVSLGLLEEFALKDLSAYLTQGG